MNELNEMQKELDAAYEATRGIPVTDACVDRLASVREHIRRAWNIEQARLAKEKEKVAQRSASSAVAAKSDIDRETVVTWSEENAECACASQPGPARESEGEA